MRQAEKIRTAAFIWQSCLVPHHAPSNNCAGGDNGGNDSVRLYEKLIFYFYVFIRSVMFPVATEFMSFLLQSERSYCFVIDHGVFKVFRKIHQLSNSHGWDWSGGCPKQGGLLQAHPPTIRRSNLQINNFLPMELVTLS